MKLAFALVSVAACLRAVGGAEEPPPPSGPADLAMIVDRGIDTLGVQDPSGIAINLSSGMLFVIGDKGDIGAIDFAGEDRMARAEVRGDIEGVTFDPEVNRLYLVDERAAVIIEVDATLLEATRRLAIDRRFGGAEVIDRSNDSIEGVEFVPATVDGGPDRWFVCRQGSVDPERWPPALLELALAVAPAGGEDRLVIARVIEFAGARDFADLHYDSEHERIVIVSDQEDALYFFDLKSGDARRAGGLPGESQEGFAVDAEGAWYIAQDSGGVIKAQPNQNLGEVWEGAALVRTNERNATSDPAGFEVTRASGMTRATWSTIR
jgi:hypothetical protein